MTISSIKNRKLIFEFALGLVLSISFLVNVSAQNKEITGKKIETITSNAAKKLEKLSYRSVTYDTQPGSEKTVIYEFVPPNRKHIIEKHIIKPNLKIYEEWIYIGKLNFYRNGENEEWEKFLPNSGDGAGYRKETEISSKPLGAIAEYKLTPNRFVNQQNTDLYESIFTFKNSWGFKPSVFHYKYWINLNGLLVKIQYINSLGEKTIDYEYDPNIKIAAPTIKTRTNKGK